MFSTADVQEQIETVRTALSGFPDKGTQVRFENLVSLVDRECHVNPDVAVLKLVGWLEELGIIQDVTREQASTFLQSMKQAVFTSARMNQYSEVFDLTIKILVVPKMEKQQCMDAIAQAWTEFFHLLKITWRINDTETDGRPLVGPQRRRLGSARDRV